MDCGWVVGERGRVQLFEWQVHADRHKASGVEDVQLPRHPLRRFKCTRPFASATPTKIVTHLGHGINRRSEERSSGAVQHPRQPQQKQVVRQLAQHHGGALPVGGAVQGGALGAVVKQRLDVPDLRGV